MKTDTAEMIVTAYSCRDFPREDLAEIVLAGRSNVGKSSLINRLAGMKKLARTGSTPGTTRSINFYGYGDRFRFVDLPGYGYAKAGRKAAEQWRRLVEDYLRTRSVIALLIHLVDSRLGPSPLDLDLAEWLDRFSMPRLIAATKADKLSGNSRREQERAIARLLGRPVVMCSATTGLGCKEIWKNLLDSAREFQARPAAIEVRTANKMENWS